MPGKLRLDDVDLLLLDLLQHDSDRTLHALGEAVGLSPSAVQRRIARYRAAGIIAKQAAILDGQLLGPVVQAVMLVTLAHESEEHHRSFTDRMVATAQVQQCYAIAGPWDYVVVLTARSLPDCRQLGNDLFKNDDNIRRYETLLVLDAVKADLTIPLPTQ